MSERLNAADQFDAELPGERVGLFQLFHGERSAHITEKRFAGERVGILRVEHRHVVPHQGEPHQHLFQIRERKHLVAGTVEHDAERFKRRRFIGVHSGECMGNTAQPSAQAARFNPADTAVSGNFHNIGFRFPELQFLPAAVFRDPVSVKTADDPQC